MQASSVIAQQRNSFIELKQQFDNGSISAQDVAEQYLEAIYDGEFQKCGTPVIKFIDAHNADISAHTLSRLSATSTTTVSRQKLFGANTYISNTGKFKIIFETTGSHAVPLADANGNFIPDYVEWVAQAMDSSYKHSVLTLGFPDPIPPGASYEVYLKDIGYYGMTRQSPTSPGGTYIEIHKDFNGFPKNQDPDGNQRGSIRATAAHEFKHAIQFKQNGWTGEADKWAEMDATLMEEMVYDDVNDYYNYLEGFNTNIFDSPEKSIIPGSYQHVTWAIYFYERFGQYFWTKAWERIEVSPQTVGLLDAVRQEIESRGESYENSIAENFLWHYASGSKLSPTNYGFKERLEYPEADIREKINTLSDTLSSSLYLTGFAGNFLEVDLIEPRMGQVSATFTYTNPNLQLAFLAYFSDGSTEHRIISPKATGTTNFYGPWNWEDITRLGIAAVNLVPGQSTSYQYSVFPTTPEETYLAQNYPNPFNPTTNITFGLTERQNVMLEVFDYTGRRIRTLVDEIREPGIYYVYFDASGLASGIYLYRLVTNKGVYVNKMTFIK